MSVNQPLNDLKCKVDALGVMFDCPICLEKLSNDVPQCIKGHHMCRKCRSQSPQCPLCKAKFKGTKNYFLESMITKFEEMKTSLANVTGIGSSKETELTIIDDGEFPCAAKYCLESLTYDEMIIHVKMDHKEDFHEIGRVHTNKFNHACYLQHFRGVSYSFIFHIQNMGIFFLKIDISQKGKVYGYVETANSTSNAQRFKYTIKMSDEDDEGAKVFSGQVESTRDKHKIKGYASIQRSLLYANEDEGNIRDCMFYCHLTITYVLENN